jgi:MFS family permease
LIRERINRFHLISNSNYTLISISLCKFLYGFYSLTIGPLLVPIGEMFNINLKTQSIVFPFNYFGQIVIIFFVGLIADKLGKKVIHILCIVLLILAALAFTYINTYSIFLILFLFMGLFGMSINLIADSSISDTFRTKRGFYLNIAHIFFGLGAITSPIMFSYVSMMTGDFRDIYYILSLLSILILILIIFAKYPTVHDETIKIYVILYLLKNKRFLLLTFFSAFTFGTLYAVSSWIPTLFHKYLHLSAKVSNYSLAFMWIAVVVGRAITAILSNKYEEISLIKVFNLIIFFVLATSFFLNSPFLLLADYLLLGLLLGTFAPLVVSYSAEIYRSHSSTRIAIVFSAGSVGMLIIPYLVGLFGEYFAIHKVISFIAPLFFVYIIIFSRSFRTSSKNT